MSDTLEVIKCPACGKEMHKIFLEEGQAILDVCIDGCGGIFFDNRELKKFDENSESITELKEAIEGKNFEPVDQTLDRICPLCGKKMVKNSVSVKNDIIIDECYNCGGKFFDHNELTKMREEYPTEADRREDFLSKTYENFEAEIERIGLENELNRANRSVFLKVLDKLFLGR